jgi:xylulokinase
MIILGLDIGSSSVKAGILRDRKILGRIERAPLTTAFDGLRAEVKPNDLLAAVARAIHKIGPGVKKIDAISLSVMSPAWVAMDRTGKALTPIVTHQDRRSVEIAIELEKRVGKRRHLRLAGNRPVPGGISSTTYRWFLQNTPAVMKRTDLVGHLNTFLHRQFTGARVIDPSNASYTGLYSTLSQRGWNDELIDAIGADRAALPQILSADAVAGVILPGAAAALGVLAGTPMTAGIVDTSSAMILAGAKVGQLFNMCGSTDVLGLCVDRPMPREDLLTRALGVGQKWMSVATLAAGGSSLQWARQVFFADLSEVEYHRLLSRLARSSEPTAVTFAPYLAGERASVEQKQAAFGGLTLASTRQQMLKAMIESLAAASAARIDLLAHNSVEMLKRVAVSGGSARSMEEILHRDWPGRWKFHFQAEASLRGLGAMQIH